MELKSKIYWKLAYLETEARRRYSDFETKARRDFVLRYRSEVKHFKAVLTRDCLKARQRCLEDYITARL